MSAEEIVEAIWACWEKDLGDWDLEGRWYNRADLIPATPGERLLAGPLARRTPDGPSGWAVCIPTSRVEHRDYDGASAQVYEVHPPDGNYANDGDASDLRKREG